MGKMNTYSILHVKQTSKRTADYITIADDKKHFEQNKMGFDRQEKV